MQNPSSHAVGDRGNLRAGDELTCSLDRGSGPDVGANDQEWSASASENAGGAIEVTDDRLVGVLRGTGVWWRRRCRRSEEDVHRNIDERGAAVRCAGGAESRVDGGTDFGRIMDGRR